MGAFPEHHYPMYRLTAEAAGEQSLTLEITYKDGAVPLSAITPFDAVDYLRDYLEGLTGVTTHLEHYETTVTQPL